MKPFYPYLDTIARKAEPRRHKDTKKEHGENHRDTEEHRGDNAKAQRRRDAENGPDANRPGTSRSEDRLLGARKGPLRTQAFLTSPFPAPRRACGAAAQPRLSSGSMMTVRKEKRTTARSLLAGDGAGAPRERRPVGRLDATGACSLSSRPDHRQLAVVRPPVAPSAQLNLLNPLCVSAPLRLCVVFRMKICGYLCDLWASSSPLDVFVSSWFTPETCCRPRSDPFPSRSTAGSRLKSLGCPARR